MSNSFIGSKIAIVTKSQSRYSGTIIGIDAQASSIVLGNVKCFGTENRLGALSNGPLAGTIVPIMQFNNSDIEDLKIVDEEAGGENSQTKLSAAATTTTTTATTTAAAAAAATVGTEKSNSIHDDPAIVSAVISSSTKENSSVPNRFIQDLNSLSLNDESKIFSKKEESKEMKFSFRDRTGLGDVGGWSMASSSKWTNVHSSSRDEEEMNPKLKSKFFDNFTVNSTSDVVHSTNRPQRWGSSNHHATQTSYRSNRFGDDEKDLPARQPFFSEDQSFVPQQRNFNNHRRNVGQRRRPMNGGNRETFYDNGNLYDDEFDFESSNRKFNKIATENEFKQTIEPIRQMKTVIDDHQQSNADFQPVYDKKKSFFDNITLQENGDLSAPIFHRPKHQENFSANHHNDRFQQRSKFRSNGNGTSAHRRTNYNNNQNGFHYRY